MAGGVRGCLADGGKVAGELELVSGDPVAYGERVTKDSSRGDGGEVVPEEGLSRRARASVGGLVLGWVRISGNILRNIPALPGERNFRKSAVTGVLLSTPDPLQYSQPTRVMLKSKLRPMT